MIEEKVHIKELYELSHRHDAPVTDNRFDYENKLFKKSLSGSMFKNETTNEYLMKLQEMQVWMLESVLVARNYWNYTVSKYYNKHTN